jgi:hypothetical protein
VKISIKIDGIDISSAGSGKRKTEKLLGKLADVRKETAECIAGMIAETFEQILHNAPQYTGNFVANMAVQAGGSAGQKGGEEYFPHVRNPEEVFERGMMPAIEVAKRENPNIVKNLTAHITKQAGWLPAVTIYNRLSDAEVVENLNAMRLRDPNVPGVHPMARGEMWLNAIAGKKIVYDSPEFHAFRMKKV